MLVEILVLGGKERRLDQVGHSLDRQIEPPLLRMLGHQFAVRRMDPRHHRRLVIRQPVHIRWSSTESLQENSRR